MSAASQITLAGRKTRLIERSARAFRTRGEERTATTKTKTTTRETPATSPAPFDPPTGKPGGRAKTAAIALEGYHGPIFGERGQCRALAARCRAYKMGGQTS